MKTILPNDRTAGTWVLACAFLLLSGNGFAQLAGDYTIGPAQDYETFTAACEAMASSGLSGAVTFIVSPGTYYEQFTIPYIATASETHTITFRSSTGNREDVVVQYDSEDADSNYVAKIAESNYLTISGITFKALNAVYARPILLENYAFGLTLQDCHFEGTFNTNAKSNMALIFGTSLGVRDLTIRGNSFSMGAYGVLLNCSEEYNLRTHIASNTFDSIGYTAIELAKHEYTEITRNEIAYSSRGIDLRSSSSGIIVRANRLDHIRQSGINFSNMKSAPGYECYITNNVVNVDGNPDVGIYLTSCSYINVYNNTVRIYTPTNINSKTLSIANCISNTINIINNNLVAEEEGYTIYSQEAEQVNLCQTNNFYTTSGRFAYWGEVCEDLRTLQEVSGKNEHALFAWPNFVPGTALVPNSAWLDGAGTPLAAVVVDVDSIDRDATHPDIGAWEFVAGPETLPPMSGSYTIGAGGDFANLNTAMEMVRVKGISDTLRLRYMTGYYEEQCIIPPVTGASSLHPVILEAGTGNRADVHLWYNADGNDDNYVLCLKGASFIHLRNLSLHGMDDLYANILTLKGMVDSLHLVNCNFYGNDQTGASARGTLVTSNDINFHYQLYDNDSLFGGGTAIMMNNDRYNALPGELHVRNNYFSNGYQNMWIRHVHAVFVDGNTLESQTYGMRLTYIDQAFEVTGNNVYARYGNGLEMSYVGFENFKTGVIRNNFFSSDYGYANRSMFKTYNCDHLDIFFNSFSMRSDDNANVPCNIQNSEFIHLRNNIFNTEGTAYSLYTNNATYSSADYNCFYTDGSNLAYWNAACADLAALQTASSLNQHSIDSDPEFVSITDLHVTSSALDGTGIPIPGITRDIDGDLRDAVAPDIGADEFGYNPNLPPFVERPVPDQNFEWNTGPHEIARLDTVFTDPEGAELDYAATTNVNWILPTITENVLYLAVGEGASGSAEMIISATDPLDQFAADTFQVTFYIPDNHPPVATNDTVITAVAVTIHVLENDYDEDGDAFLVTGFSYQGTSAVSLNVDNTALIYEPGVPTPLKDTITYFIEDVHGATDSAQVYITLYNLMTGFREMETALGGLSHGTLSWGDYDDDGDLDLLQCGWTGTMTHFETRVITNTGEGFEVSNIACTGLSPGTSGSAAWFDFDNDNDLDVVVTGRLDQDELTKRSLLYENIGANLYLVENSGLEHVTSSSVSLADVDHDGLTDLLFSGSGEEGDFTHMQMNAGSGFASVDTDLPGTHGGAACLVDINNDGEKDVFLCGADIEPSRVYIAGPDAFVEYQTIVPGMYNASADFSDIDGDGDQDLAIMGTDGEKKYLLVYLNVFNENNGAVFSLHSAYEGIESGDLAWADFDCDGDMDLAVSGNRSLFEQETFILKNNGGVFTEQGYGLKGLGRSSLAWGDFDNDGDPDLALMGTGSDGPQTAIYRVDNVEMNDPPVLVGNLRTVFEDPYYVLSWDVASDDHTPVAGITYNVRMGTSSRGTDIISPMAVGEFLKTPGPGNAGSSTSMKILGLEPGTYFWGVQAIDQSFQASGFTMEATLVITGIGEEFDDDGYRIYPNPMMDQCWISVPDPGMYHIRINDLSGKLVMECNRYFDHSPAELNTSGWTAGCYILQLTGGETVKQSRIVKQ